MNVLLLLLTLIFTGCQTIPASKVFFLENRQTSHLKLEDNLDARLFHSAPPYITEDKIVTGNAQDGLNVFNRKGRLLWKKDIEGGVEGGFTSKGNRLYFGGNDYYFYSLNLESGVEVWRYKTEGEILSLPVLHNDRLYFATGNGIVYCLSAKDGSLVWRYKRNIRESFTVRGASSPLIHQQRLYIGFADGFFTALNSNDGSLAWERNLATSPKFKDVDARAVIDGDRLFVSAYDSALYALTLKEGRVIWSLDHGSSYPVEVSGNHLFYSTSNGSLLQLDKSSGGILWTKKAKGIFQAPRVKDNLLFIADTAGPLSVYNVTNQRLLKAFYPGHGISSPIVLDNEKSSLYFLSMGANFYHLDYGWKSSFEVY